MVEKIEIVLSYAHKDEKLLDTLLNALEGPLKPLKQKGMVSLWSERDIMPGTVVAQEIRKHLQTAHIILLLISADFMAQDFCYSDEMQGLVKRHQSGDLRILPILLREIDWQEAPFGNLQPLPDNEEFVNSWDNRDKAFLNIVKGVKKVVNELLASSQGTISTSYAGGDKKNLPGEQKPVLPVSSTPTKLTDGKRQRLEENRHELQVAWNLHNKKIQRLRQALAIETDPLVIFKYEQQLLQENASLKPLEADLDAIEQELQ